MLCVDAGRARTGELSKKADCVELNHCRVWPLRACENAPTELKKTCRISIIPRFSTTGVSALLCGAAAPCLYEFIAVYKTEKSYFLWVLLFSPQKKYACRVYRRLFRKYLNGIKSRKSFVDGPAGRLQHLLCASICGADQPQSILSA